MEAQIRSQGTVPEGTSTSHRPHLIVETGGETVVETGGESHASAREGADSPYRRALEAVLGTPFTEGNEIRAYRNGDRIFPAMLEAIESAEQSIDMETYVFWEGPIAERFAESLAEAAARGVRVRVLLDAFGAHRMPHRCERRMREAGADVRRFHPFRFSNLLNLDRRTHRKILVCDGTVGFTGGVGIASQWEGDARDETEWRDTHFRLRGPAIAGLWAGFASDWLQVCPDFVPAPEPWDEMPCRLGERPGDSAIQVIRAGSPHAWSDIATTFRTILPMARDRIRIGTAYFVPDPTIVELLTDAAARGVSVQVILPGPHMDHRVSQRAGQAMFDDLLAGGVEIHEYQPTMYHAKVITIDRVLALLGSANLNQRSLRKDQELSLAVVDSELVAELDRHFERDLDRCEKVDLAAWRRRGLRQRAMEKLARLIRKQL